ncbi:hypothetical protein [Streptomyces sp. DHE17-7]|uniref:hypothetical protein n=1 Tax=Streptomyces sp. DHE17-7 TaxID=2759949 RepID=UPI0022EA8166|nr:hypothetical protein [Streptomyces sp. DHE17-7]MBJ6623487.1 hypothetical protein [Streptomyces sp. DHE17-7]
MNDLVGEVVDLGFGQFPDPVGERVEAGGGHGTAGDVHQPVEAARERGHLGCELRDDLLEDGEALGDGLHGEGGHVVRPVPERGLQPGQGDVGLLRLRGHRGEAALVGELRLRGFL